MTTPPYICLHQTNRALFQQRNKPKEAPKVPEQAPFFLPTLPGVEPRFAPDPKPQDPKKPTRRFEKTAASMESTFYQKLLSDDRNGDCKPTPDLS